MRHTTFSTVLIAGIAAYAMAGTCRAAVSSVTLDWSQLKTQVSGVSGGPAPTLTLNGFSTHTSANASSAGDGSESLEHSVGNWTDLRDLTAHTSNAEGKATASFATVSLSDSATPGAIGCCGSSSNSLVNRQANFTLSGPGTLLFSVPYSFSVSGTPFDFSDSSDVRIEGRATFQGFDSTGNAFADGSKSIFADSNNPGAASGLLVFGVVAGQAGSGSVSFDVFASANNFSGGFVPEPSAMFGLLAGLGAVVVIGKRRIERRA
jgi:hypothetical protein